MMSYRSTRSFSDSMDMRLRYIVLLSLVDICLSGSFICTSTADSCFENDSSELRDRVTALEEKVQQLQNLLQTQSLASFTTINGLPRDCEEIYSNGTRVDGVYSVSPDGRCPFFVYCDMTNGGWTVIQRRIDGTVNFYRPWDDYVQGFGELDGEHWLGLEKIHRLTKDGSQVYFDMTLMDGSEQFSHYKVFTVHEAATVYRMNVDVYGYEGTIKSGLSYHDNMKFSTYDRDNDQHSGNCCENSMDGGGWWYKACYEFGNINGVYGRTGHGGLGYWEGKNVQIKTITSKVKAMNGTC